MFDDFIIRAVIGGGVLAIIAAPWGCLLIWQRMAFFGESLAHGALLGVGVGIILQLHIIIGVFISSCILAVIFFLIRRYNNLSNDTILGIISHIFLALGVIFISLLSDNNINITSYLFGDILSLTNQDIGLIFVVGLLTMVILKLIWHKLLLIILNEELAIAENINVESIRFLFTLALALIIAVAMQYVGILLITSLLIIPAATAHRFAKTAQSMVVIASVVGMFSVFGGVVISAQWDIPTGPAIVVSAALLFVCSCVYGAIFKKI